LRYAAKHVLTFGVWFIERGYLAASPHFFSLISAWVSGESVRFCDSVHLEILSGACILPFFFGDDHVGRVIVAKERYDVDHGLFVIATFLVPFRN